MTTKQLQEWLFLNSLEDQWWVSFDEITDENPLKIIEIEEKINSGQYAKAQALHVSQAELLNPPWIEVELPAAILPPMVSPMQSNISRAKIISGYSQQPNVITFRATKSRGVYIILGLFFGLLGFHNFYAGYNGRGAAQLIITLLLGWLFIGIVISGLWSLIEVCAVTKDAEGNRMT
jgi:TM2 domain-containing membrane protein YozV